MPRQQFKVVGVSFDERQSLIPLLQKGEMGWGVRRSAAAVPACKSGYAGGGGGGTAAPSAAVCKSRPLMSDTDQAVACVREPDNPHDPNAVAVRGAVAAVRLLPRAALVPVLAKGCLAGPALLLAGPALPPTSSILAIIAHSCCAPRHFNLAGPHAGRTLAGLHPSRPHPALPAGENNVHAFLQLAA